MDSENRPDTPADDLSSSRRFTTRPLLLPEDEPESGDGASAEATEDATPSHDALRVAPADEFFSMPLAPEADATEEDDDDDVIDEAALEELMPLDASDPAAVWPGTAAPTAEAASDDEPTASEGTDAYMAEVTASEPEASPTMETIAWETETDIEPEAEVSATPATADASDAEAVAEAEPVSESEEPVFETLAHEEPVIEEEPVAESHPVSEPEMAAEVEDALPEAVPADGTEAPAVTAAVDDAFEAQASADKADVPASEGIEGSLDVPMLGPDDFEVDELKRVLRLMLTSRRLDEKMLVLLKQGKGFFHIGSSGHEASQIAIGRLLEGGRDWFSFYYRDLASALAIGVQPVDVLRSHYAKATDPFSGGRQMSEHFSSRELNILAASSSVGAQYMPAVGVGLAIQRERPEAGASAIVYASGGEGSTSQGAFHESLNWAAKEALPVLFHVQDNKFAISVPVEEQTAGGSIWHLLGGYAGLARVRYDGTDFFAAASVAKAAVEHLRAGNGPVALLADVVRLLPHSSSDDHKKYREDEALEADRARDPIPQFVARLIEAGVVTEEEVEAMRDEVKAEVDDLSRQVASEPDPDPALATKHVYYEGEDTRTYETDGESGDLVVMVDAINHALDEEMARDDRVLVYGEDVGGGKGGVFTATRGLTARYGSDRCFNSPLAEHSVIGSAVGLAASGYKPVIEIQFADYIWPGLQPLRNQVASFRYRSNGEWACPMVIRVPCGGYIHGGLCHSQNIEAFFGHFPGLQVVMPSNAADAKGLLKAAIRGEDPVLFLEHKSLYRQGPARSPEPHDEYLVPLGKARIAREGTDLTIVTWGALVYKALNVAKTLEREGVSVEVIDVRSILPFDTEAVLTSARKTNRVLVAYEDHEFMGFGAEVAAQIADKAFGYLDAPVKRVAGAFSSIPFADPLEKAVLPQDDDVLAAAREVLDF